MLERAYHVLGELSYVILKESGEYKLAGDIYEYLADINQSETINNTEVDRSEPVAYLYDLDAYCDHRPEQDVLAKKIPKGIPSEYLKNIRPLYLHPAPRKQDDEPVATLDHNGNFKLLRMVGVTVGHPINLYALEEKNK